MVIDIKKEKDRTTVPKIWGGEDWIANDEDTNYCGKIIRVNKGYQCSLHHHVKKDETFYLAKGKILMELEQDGKLESVIMNEGEALHVKPGQKHRFTGLEKYNEIFEFSTYHEDSDSIRSIDGGKTDISEILK
ncbi:MAG: cupin domain-containing protein [Nanoarchaeota archaeon]|nr:cupin domain-containing protein [Nanoarchaeota archaeon]